VAIALAVVLYPLLHGARRRVGVTSRTCVCVGAVFEEAQLQPDGRVLLVRTGTLLDVNKASVCAERYQGRLLGLEAGRLLDALHYLSGGAVGFARGLNDTPKIVAMLLAVQVMPDAWGWSVVAAAMA